MFIRRSAVAAATAAAVVTGAVAVPAQAYTVDYNKETDKCTISFTERDQERINEAYKNVYGLLADQLVKTLGEKESTARYSQEQRKEDVDVYVTWAKTADDPYGWSKDPEVAKAQDRLWKYERKNYNMFVALIKASRKDVITQGEEVISREEAKQRGETLGLDLKAILKDLGLTGILGSVFGGVEDITHSVKIMMRDDVLQVAGPIGAYNKALTACAESKSESSSVPAGSSLSINGLIGVIIAGIVGLVLVAAGIGFAVRPAVEDFLGRG